MDIEDSRGNTPLHFAAQTGSLKIIQHLCKNREAIPLIPNIQRQTPRDLAGDAAIKAYLEDQEKKFKTNNTPSFVAKIVNKYKKR